MADNEKLELAKFIKEQTAAQKKMPKVADLKAGLAKLVKLKATAKSISKGIKDVEE